MSPYLSGRRSEHREAIAKDNKRSTDVPDMFGLGAGRDLKNILTESFIRLLIMNLAGILSSLLLVIFINLS